VKDCLFQSNYWELKKKRIIKNKTIIEKGKELKKMSSKNTIGNQIFHEIQIETQQF